MTRPDKDGFRITTWPPVRLPHPAERLAWRYELRGDVLVPVGEDEEDVPVRATETAGETYLVLRALELRDTQAVLEFVNTHGVLGLRADNFAAARGETAVNRFIAPLTRDVEKARRLQPVTAPKASDVYPARDAWNWSPPIVETLQEFHLAAGWLHDLTNLWLVASGRDAVEKLTRWHVVSPKGGLTRPTAARLLARGLDPALRWFYPRVMTKAQKDYRGIPITLESAAAFEFGLAPLFAICALELRNHIFEDAELKTCANESCGRLFVRQEGRARAGQYRTSGVRFCSERCLRAQKQREYRQRKRGAKR